MRAKNIAGLLILLLCYGCGETSSTTTPIPTAPPVDEEVDNELNPPPPPVDSRLPDLSRAVAINLKDKSFGGLEDLAHTVFPPLVGDPLVLMELPTGREREVEGSITIAFEDRVGFWGARLKSVEKVGTRTSEALDMVFSDDEFVIRVVGALSGDVMDGALYYRLRKTGEYQCKKPVVTCELYQSSTFSHTPPWLPPEPPECRDTSDWVTPCRAYMNLSHSEVKELGSFEAEYSAWSNP